MPSAAVRRLLVGALLCLGSVAGAHSAQPQVSASPATSIVRELVALPFGGAMADWRRKNQRAEWVNAPNAPKLPESEQEWGLTGDWCAIGRDPTDAYVRQALFYPYRAELPLDCRLEELRYEFSTLPGRPDPYEDLARTFEVQFGEPFFGAKPEDARLESEMIADYKRHPGLPMQLWRQTRYWTTGTSEVFLFRYQQSVQVIARSFNLSGAVTRAPLRNVGARSAAANAVRAKFPMAAELILSGMAREDQPNVRRTAVALLDAVAKAGTLDERAKLSLAAAFVLGSLHVTEDPPFKDRPELAPLVARGVHLTESPYDAGIWYYDNQLWTSIIEKYGMTRWGQLAFVERLEGGWSDDCGDNYRDVIVQGDRWLRAHPQSEFVLRVTFAVAQANESWWTLSQTPEDKDDEDMITASEHQEGSAAALARAIQLYERILRVAPDSYEAFFALRSLIRLKTGVYTGGTHFYCRYA
jgi:hypothetical protein